MKFLRSYGVIFLACLSIVSFSWTCQIVLATRRYPNPVQLVSNKTVKEYEVQSNLSKLSKGEGRRAFYLEHQATNNLTSLCKVCGIGEISTRKFLELKKNSLVVSLQFDVRTLSSALVCSELHKVRFQVFSWMV